MSDELPVGDKTYISSKRASELSGYAQDYIGQLARSGQIEAKQTGGLWYVYLDSLTQYKSKPKEIKNELVKESKSEDKESDVLVSFDGRDYISANRASKLTGYNQDYVGQLARAGKVLSRQVGNRWYIDREGILTHKSEKDSMLAAVQSVSVGIHREPTEMTHEKPMVSAIEYSNEPLLTYNLEKSDLNPRIEGKRNIEEERSYSIVHESDSETAAVPIRRAPTVSSPQFQAKMPQRTIASRRRSKSGISLLTGIGILTVVIVIAVGFLGFNMRATFASSAKNPLGMTANAVSGLISGPLSGIMGIFESIVAPPLQYQRSD